MRLFDEQYMRWQLFAERHSLAILAGFGLMFAIATAGLMSLKLDMSFRPLFASGAEIAEPTDEFEAIFGQSSGAWITAIVENGTGSKAEFVRTVANLSTLAANIPHVSEVLSLTSARVPQWHRSKLSFVAPIPEYLLEPPEHEELLQQYDQLLDGTRFVNWLVSADGSRLLIAARVDLPLADLEQRRDVVKAFENLLRSETPSELGLYFSGVSVVEVAYEEQVLRDQLVATVLASIVLTLLLFWTLGNLRAVIICLTPVTLAIPMTLGLMGWFQLPVTIINTAIPAIIMVVGVADAVHMLTTWLEARGEGADKPAATRTMLAATGSACFFTTITTMGGFLALLSAKLGSVGAFGVGAATGIFVAWCANQILIPWMLRRVNAGDVLPGGFVNRYADGAVTGMLRFATGKPRSVIAIALVCTTVCCFLIPGLNTDQRFNQELPESHPINRGQQILERDFGGFLGPEISIRRKNQSSMVDDETLRQLDGFVKALRALPETEHVWTVRDILPRQVPETERADAIDSMREHPVMALHVNELINPAQNHLAIIVRIGDIGTRRAGDYHATVQRLANDLWGPAFDVQVVGQWWLAQHGMRLLLRDMLVSFATAMLFVMPLLWIALRQRRLFVAAFVTNILPLLLPLAFMAATGITLRIGTAVVLAIALGIVVDNTLHIIIRLRQQLSDDDTMQQVSDSMRSTGRAVIFTTLALIGGFLSMLSNELLAIRDMGIVAAVTFLGAMLADLLLLPAVYVALGDRRTGTNETPEISGV